MRTAVMLISLLLGSACATPDRGEAEDPPPVSGERDLAEREQAARERLERLERVEMPTTPAVVGEVPVELMARIRADAAGRLGTDSDELVVARAEAVTWNDGSLGCPQPDLVYTQALEPGYWVVLQDGGQQLDYRARASGYFFICEASREKGLPR